MEVKKLSHDHRVTAALSVAFGLTQA